MAETIIYFDPIYEKHDTGYGHPERPERLPVAMQALERSGLLERVEVRSPRDATVEEVELVHTPGYVARVKQVADAGGGNLDMDTSLSRASYEAALKSAGAILEGVDDALAGKLDRAFCLVRPPGHHALPGRGMGFCLFNNIAIGARHALRSKDVSRVLILDWDAHHGNGTQDVFYDDPSVLYVSLHQYPHYPGTGAVEETGRGAGAGYTINFPFPRGTGEDLYREAFERVVLPAAGRFAPDLVLVSAGYDSHFGDLLCSMQLSDGFYRVMTDYLANLAEEHCNGRLIVTLEGGYNLEAEARSVVQTVAGLAGVDVAPQDEPVERTAFPEQAREVVEEALGALRI